MVAQSGLTISYNPLETGHASNKEMLTDEHDRISYNPLETGHASNTKFEQMIAVLGKLQSPRNGACFEYLVEGQELSAFQLQSPRNGACFESCNRGISSDRRKVTIPSKRGMLRILNDLTS